MQQQAVGSERRRVSRLTLDSPKITHMLGVNMSCSPECNDPGTL